ncbi:Exocyst complex component Sec3 [Rhizoctonia solani]|uniref:Exocyst complex component Sec3 n=1 Tax=Rhizoctonia solani TaxID=456999 RepID=A0A8H8P5D1_9AGAM|nr:Exocyst complex component Sec3 [Rhizoctonia solani]QRW24607.1 Exocyst complex component Sec3 [Rhizoctonia solani]
MSDTTVKDEIISSLNNRSLTHSSPPEDYVSHIKIWEENLPTNGQAPAEEGALKPRYILLTSELYPQGKEEH